MAKDPAFLWYANDWLGGTLSFTRHQKGAYIDLLMLQFNMFDEGHLSMEDIQTLLGSDIDIWEKKLKSKFKEDSAGKFFNETLEMRIMDRRKYTQSRRDNLLKSKEEKEEVKPHKVEHMNPHMSNHMEIENEIKNTVDKRTVKDKIKKKKVSKVDVTKEVLKKTSKNNSESINERNGSLKFIHQSEEFLKIWNILIETKSWRKKITHALQINLDKLAIYPEAFAIQLMNDAINGKDGNAWQGVVFAETPEMFERWKKQNKNLAPIINNESEFNTDFRGNSSNNNSDRKTSN